MTVSVQRLLRPSSRLLSAFALDLGAICAVKSGKQSIGPKLNRCTLEGS